MIIKNEENEKLTLIIENCRYKNRDYEITYANCPSLGIENEYCISVAFENDAHEIRLQNNDIYSVLRTNKNKDGKFDISKIPDDKYAYFDEVIEYFDEILQSNEHDFTDKAIEIFDFVKRKVTEKGNVK